MKRRLENTLREQDIILKTKKELVDKGQVDIFIEVDNLGPDEVLGRVEDALNLQKLFSEA